MLIKKGDATEIRIRDYSSVQSIINPEIIENFTKQAKELKRIAPRADDFLYFSTVMMHAAEAACINEDGSPKMYKGKPVTSNWDESTGSYIWKCTDPNIQPYRNQRGDIFPEAELIKAHKEWVGKPLCIDHQASSVDHTRGFIVDTFYDYDLKRIVALAAIDKKSYPELARKVESGTSNNVSMGTGVGRAVCTEKGCHRVIKSANEFCEHMKYKSGYGEVNLDLSPIELSIVVAGADKRAKIKHIIASVDTLNNYVKSKEELLKKGSNKDLKFTSSILEDLRSFIDNATEELEELKSETSSIEDDEEALMESEELETEEDPSGELLSAPAGARLADELIEMKKAASLLETRLHKMHKKVSDISLNSLMKSASDLHNKIALAEDTFHVSMDYTDGEGRGAVRRQFEMSTEKLADMENFLDTVCEELKDIQGHSSDLEDSDSNKKEAFESMTDNIETKISSLKQQFSNLVKGYNMTIDKKAYFQGGGGVNEPTPGKQKYPVDPMNEKLRQEDHHMKGQKPFPEVGDVEKLYGDDLEKKKLLARAELAEREERAIKRAATLEAAREALKKNAYFQGGGGVNEPTPGKQKYPVDPMNDKLRQDDHHMKGQKPFPEVGDVEKLYGDDLEKKKKLSRASKLKGSLIKGASLGEYTWKVTDPDGNVLFRDTVKSLAKGDELLYTTVASEEYGHGLINRIQKQAFSKMAQDAGLPAPAAAPAAPVAEMPADMPMPSAPAAGDTGLPAPESGTGDVKETALELSEQVRDLSSDLVEAVQNLTGEQEEMGEVAPKAASALFAIQREANVALTDVITEMVEDLSDRKDELTQIAGMVSAGKVNEHNSDIFQSISQASFDETKKAIAQGRALMGTFLKYARGAQALIKQAQMEQELAETSGDSDFEDDSESLESVLDRVDSQLDDVDTTLDTDEELDMTTDDTQESEDMDMGDDEETSEDELESDDLDLDLEGLSSDLDAEETDSVDSDFDALLADMVEVKTPDGKTVKAPAGSEVKTVSASRNEMRAKIAAKAMQLSGVAAEMADSVTIGGIDANEDRAVSENIVDQQEKTMSLVLGKVKVRKEAERIHQLIAQGEIDSDDLDSLVSLGVDPEAVKYYKEFYGEAEGGKEFAAELTAEHKKSEAAEEVEAYKVKIARAYELVHDMVSKDLCPDDRDSIGSKVNEVVQYNDAAFDSLKRIVASAPVRKIASLPVSGLMPQVGVVNEGGKTKGSGNSSVDVYMEALQGGRSSRFSR